MLKNLRWDPNVTACTTLATRRVTSFVLAAAIAAAGGAGCSPAGEGESENVPPIGQVSDELASNISCAILPAHSTLTGGGSFRSGLSYNPTGCPSGYLLDLNDYDSSYDLGPIVTFGDAPGTTASECVVQEVRAYVWRLNGTNTPTFLGSANAFGTWKTNAWGESHCELPLLSIKNTINTLVDGADYRVAMRAQTLNSQGTMARRRLYFETVRSVGPETGGKIYQQIQALLANVSDGEIDASTQALFAARGTIPGGVICRSLALQLELDRLRNPLMRRLGASAARLDNKLRHDETVHDRLCRVPATPDPAPLGTLQVNLVRSLREQQAMVGEIATNLGLSSYEAAFAVEQQLENAFRNLRTTCGMNPDEVLNFLHDGSVPTGMRGPNVLFRNCNDSLTSLQGRLGIGATGGSAANFRRCMDQAVADPRAICSDPRAGDEGDSPAPAPGVTPPSPPPPPPIVTICENEATGEMNPECAKVEEKVDTLEDLVVDTVVRIDGYTEAAKEFARAERNLERVEILNVTVASGWLVLPVLYKELYSLAKDEANKAAQEEREFLAFLLCQDNPTAPGCDNYRCPEFGFTSRRGSYETTPDGDGGSRELSVYDRINQCTCQHLSSSNAVFCPTGDERTKQECLTDPFTGGPDDGPRPECVEFLQPDHVDRDSLELEFCKLALPNCATDVYRTQAGGCGCADGPGGDTGDPADLCRNITNVSRCLDDATAMVEVNRCSCQPAGSGSLPWGGSPDCRVLPKYFPGAADFWPTINPDDVFIDRRYDLTGPSGTPGRDVLMFKQGFTQALTPALRRSNFANVGSHAVLDVYVPSAVPPSGYKGAAQLYFTGGNLTNQFVQQIELQNRPTGQVSTLEFALPANVRSILASGDEVFRFGIAMNSAPTATGFIGLADLRFGRTLTAVTNPDPECQLLPSYRLQTLPPRLTFPDGRTIVPEGPLRPF